jgi:hypothetical protein
MELTEKTKKICKIRTTDLFISHMTSANFDLLDLLGGSSIILFMGRVSSVSEAAAVQSSSEYSSSSAGANAHRRKGSDL